MAKNKYPEVVTGLHYRISNGSRYITISFVMERNVVNPELGFNFTETLAGYVAHSSQLCFLTKQDAENFINKYNLNPRTYSWSRDYTPYIAKGATNLTLIRVNVGGNIPCYATKDCCEHYSNRTSQEIKDKLSLEPVLNPFGDNDPEMQKAVDRMQKNKEKGAIISEIVQGVLQELKAEEVTGNTGYWRKWYRIPLNLDSNNWSSEFHYDSWLSSRDPYLYISVEDKGSFSKEINLHCNLRYNPLAGVFKKEVKNDPTWRYSSERFFKTHPEWRNFQAAIEKAMKENPLLYPKFNETLFGLEIDHYYKQMNGDATVQSRWTPGVRNNKEALVNLINNRKELAEEGARIYEKIAQNFGEDDFIE